MKTINFSVLRNPGFRKFCVASALSQLGLWIQVCTMMHLVRDSAINLALFTLAANGPLAICSLFAGRFADRYDKRRLLLVTQSMLAGISLLTTCAVAMGCRSPWMLLLLTVMSTTTASLDKPLQSAWLWGLFEKSEAGSATSLCGGIFNLCRLAAPFTVAVLLAYFLNPTICFAINTLSYVGNLIVYSTTPSNTGRDQHATVSGGVKFVASNFTLGTSFLLNGLVLGVSYIGWTLAPIVTKAFGGGERTLMLQMSAYAAGATAGYFFAGGSEPGRLAKQCGLAALVSAACLLAMASGNISVLIVAQAVIGFTVSLQLGCTASLIPLLVEPNLQGRVSSIMMAFNFAASPIATMSCAALSKHIGVASTFACAGIVCLLATVTYLVAMSLRRNRDCLS